MKAQISVVMAARNAEKTLAEALESILQQSLPPQEVIVVLNGCQDKSAALVAHFASRNPTIRILESPPQGGVTEAARLGCEAATQPLLARMDCDDVAHPERLATQARLWEAEAADLVTCRVSPLDSQGQGLDRYIEWANSLKTPGDFRAGRFIESPVIQPGVFMTQEAYHRAGGYRSEAGPEDYDLWLRMLAQGARFFQAPEAHLGWRDSPTRLTRSHEDYSVHQMTATKARHLALLPRVNEHGVTIAGSGPQGRRLAKLLLAEGATVQEFYDVDPSKIGRLAHGIPIVAPSSLGGEHHKAVLLGCVGRGGRKKIHELATARGYREGHDFFSCC